MTSAVEQAGNEYPVGFPPHRDGPLSQSHFSQFWYRTKSHPEAIPVIPPSMGASTPPPRGVLKLDVYAGSSKETTHELPHWMDSKRGLIQPAARSEITPEAGPSTPMKCPPRQLIEPPNTEHQFSSPAGSYVALFEPRSKLTWARQAQAQTPIVPAGANYPVHASSNRASDQPQRDSVQVRKESQKENVMSLKEVNSIMMSTSKGGASPSTGSSPIGQPPSIRALATLAESKSKTALPDESILQLHLRYEPCIRSPVTSPEKNCGGRRVHHEVVEGSDTTHRVKQETPKRPSQVNDGDSWITMGSGSKPGAHEFSHAQQGHESARPLINSTRSFQPRRQESEGSLDLHADLSLALQPATESTHHAVWHGCESPSRLLAQKWSEIHSPKLSSHMIVNSSQCRSTNSTPSAPQTPAESLALYHLMPSIDTVAREQPREQSRTDDERMGGLNDGTTATGKKRKQFRKIHKTSDYSSGVSSPIELNNPAEYADLRDEIKKRVKREVSDVVFSGNQLEAHETTHEDAIDQRSEPTSFQLWLQACETASHPKKHDFFPDKPRYANATVPAFTPEEFPGSTVRICGTSSAPLFKVSTESRGGLLYHNGVISDNAAAGSFDTTAPNKSVQHSMPLSSPRKPTIATEMHEDTELGLGRPSTTLNPSVEECIRTLPTVVKHLGEHGEEANTGDGSWQRSRLFTVPAHAPMPIGHPTFSAGEPSLPLSLSCFTEPVRNPPAKTPLATTPKPEEEWGKSLALSATPVPAVPHRSQSPSTPTLNFQERFALLQSFLKHCDEQGMSQTHALRNLSAAARSGVAVELESKAMWLSIEEGLEMRRLNSINVMGWSMVNAAHVYQGDDGATPRGRRIPVPGDMRPSPFFDPRVRSGVVSVAAISSPYS